MARPFHIHRGRDEAFHIVSGSFRPWRGEESLVPGERLSVAREPNTCPSQAARVLDVTRSAGAAVLREMQVVGMGLESESAALKSSSFHAPAITTP
jgi:hypothetical protein